MYYIYHIPGKKVGVTKNLERRVTKEQGYKPGEYEILLASTDVDEVSQKEAQYQKQLGYDKDFNNYKTLTNQFKKGDYMAINITDQTVTFPVGKDGLKNYLANNTGFKFKIDETEVRLDQKVQDWIIKNARTSHFRNTRTYVYNKSLVSFIDELVVEHTFKKGVKKATSTPSSFVFQDIRNWARERGIYDEGNSHTQYVKLIEEAGELAKALLKQDRAEIIDGIGDMVVVLTNLAELEGLAIEGCVAAAYRAIKNRSGKMENGTFVKSA
jgi:NTP pyrophosphatase (non-canonical NTP hydrolase)